MTINSMILIITSLFFTVFYILYFLSPKNERRKFLFSLIGMTIALLLAFFLYIISMDKSREHLNPDIQIQLENLDDMEKSLSNLQNFIESQKTKLIESEEKLELLIKEQKKLKPLVETKKEVIEAIFSFQEERNNSKVWFNRFSGVIFGVLTSLLASFIYQLFTTRSMKK